MTQHLLRCVRIIKGFCLMDRYRLQDSEIDKAIEGGGSRVDLGAGAPRPTDRGFSVGIPGLAGFGVKPEMFAEGFFGRESPRDGFTVSQSGGGGKFGATVVGPDGHRFTAGVPLNYLSGEVEFGDELQAQGAPENIEFGTNGIERGPIEGKYESPGGFSASGSYDPRTGEGGFYLNKAFKFEDGGAVGGIGPYLDQLEEPRRFANGGRISMEPARYSGPITTLAPVFQRQGSFGSGIGGLFDSPVSSAADPVSAEVLPDGLTGSGDGGGGGYGDPDPSATGPSQPGGLADLAGYAATALGMTTGLGAVSAIANAVSHATTGKSIFGHITDMLGFGDDAPADPGMETGHSAGMGISGYGSDDTGNTGDDAPGPGGNEGAVGGTGNDDDGDDTGGGDGDDGGPGEGDDGGPEGLADGGVAGLSAAREFKDAGTFPDFMAARLGSMDRRDDAVARKLLGGNASSQVLDQASRILNSSSDPIRTFADGGSVRSQRLPPRRPPLLGGVPEVSPSPELVRMADNEFVHTVDPYITNPIARMELLRRTANPGVYEGEEFSPNNEPTSISDFLSVRPVLDNENDVSQNFYLGPLRNRGASLAELKKRLAPGVRGANFPTPKSLTGSETGILLNQTAPPFVEKYHRDPDTGQISSEVKTVSQAETLQHELIHAGLSHLRITASDPNSPPYVSVKGKDSALGRILQPNPDKRPSVSNDHLAYINILDVASAIKSGSLDPTDEEQLDTWGFLNGNSVSAMQAGIELSRDRSSEEDKGLRIPEKYQVKEISLEAAKELKKAEEELMEQIKPVLKRDGFSQAHIEAAFGPEEETYFLRLLRSASDLFSIETFADGGSVRSQRLPPDRPPRLGGISRVPRRDLVRLADDEFAHTVAPHIEGSPLASAELMMRQTRPGSGGSGTEIPLLSDDLDVRPVTLRRFTDTPLLDQAYRGRLRHLDSGKPLYDSSDFEGRFPIPVHEGLQGLMYGGDRFNPETVDPRVKGVLVNNITDRYGRTQAEASGDTLEGLSDAARANNERVARVSRHELEHAFLTRARNSLSDYIKTTGTDSALGTLLTTNVLGERGRGGKNEHRFLINIYDASSLVDDGRMDPRNQKQLDLYSKMHDLSSGEMKAAVALSETGNVADLPEKYKDREYQPLVDLVRRAEEEAATQIRSALNSEGYTKAQIDSALGAHDFERMPKTNFVGMDSTGNNDDTKNVLRAEPHFVGMDSTGNNDDTKNPVSRFRRFRETFRSILGGIN